MFIFVLENKIIGFLVYIVMVMDNDVIIFDFEFLIYFILIGF